ncbi:MAG: hypothetical protein AAFV07_04765 [Bacteroidota bacterium]
MSADAMQSELYQVFKTHMMKEEPQRVLFYGAGVKGAEQNRIMGQLLKGFFPMAQVEVQHDMLAAARSTGHREGIICILGTGSNSCWYKDGAICGNYGGLGYLLGDEGSGMDLGRYLLAGLLHNDFPDEVRQFVEEQEALSVEELKLAVYQDDTPNVRLARLAQHLEPFKHIPAVHDLLVDRFKAFLAASVTRYPGWEAKPLQFVGSVSYFYAEALIHACKEMGTQTPEIVRDPIEDLLQYHMEEYSDWEE